MRRTLIPLFGLTFAGDAFGEWACLPVPQDQPAFLQTRLRFLPATQGRQLPLRASKRVSGILRFPTHEAVMAHFEAGSHEIRKSPSWVHGFLLHLFPN
jgi:hypothetical protein